MPLQSRAVDAIFTRLLVRYGAAWARMWDEIPIEAVKADWAAELSGMSSAAIAYALDNLPADRPPATAKAFQSLAHSMPRYAKALPAPKVNPARVREALDKLNGLKLGDVNPMQWAYELQQREHRGDALTEAERAMWRRAIEVAPIGPETPGLFRGVDPATLPPGMRQGAAS